MPMPPISLLQFSIQPIPIRLHSPSEATLAKVTNELRVAISNGQFFVFIKFGSLLTFDRAVDFLPKTFPSFAFQDITSLDSLLLVDCLLPPCILNSGVSQSSVLTHLTHLLYLPCTITASTLAVCS